MRPIRRIRLFVARRPLVYWLLVAAVAVATAGVVLTRVAALERAREQWGVARTVLVARHPLAVGEVVHDADVRPERRPIALLPADAVARLPHPAVVSAAVQRGEPLVTSRLGRAGAGAVSGRLPTGTRGVTVPVGDIELRVVPGDRVDLVDAGPGRVIGVVAVSGIRRRRGRRAPVLDVAKGSLVIAVRTDELRAVAAALTGGSFLVALDAEPAPAGSG